MRTISYALIMITTFLLAPLSYAQESALCISGVDGVGGIEYQGDLEGTGILPFRLGQDGVGGIEVQADPEGAGVLPFTRVFGGSDSGGSELPATLDDLPWCD